jgi:hypothetical protein
MKGHCKLFGDEAELRHSHIFPKFVIDYQKQTGSKYLRSFTEPNRRQQDGLKRYFLSDKAEQKFSLSEKWFAEQVFKPYLTRQKTQFPYDDNLFYFVISFLWRVIILNLHDKPNEHKPYLNLLLDAELEWRKFLANWQYPRNFDKVFIWLTDDVKSHSIDAKGVGYFMTRVMDCHIIYYDDDSYLGVYGRFLKFTFWAELKNENPQTSRDTLRISPTTGTLRFPQEFNDVMFSNFILERIKGTQNWPTTTDSQQDKIVDEIMKNPQAFIDSEAGKAIINDFENLDRNKNRT